MFGLFLVLAHNLLLNQKEREQCVERTSFVWEKQERHHKASTNQHLVPANAKSCRTRRLRSNDIEHVINSLRLNEPSQYRVICKRVPRNEERNFSRVRVSWNLLFPVLENERKIGQIRYTAFC